MLYFICYPMATRFISPSALAELTSHPVRSDYKMPDEADVLPPANAVVLAPATFNTINKWSTEFGFAGRTRGDHPRADDQCADSAPARDRGSGEARRSQPAAARSGPDVQFHGSWSELRSRHRSSTAVETFSGVRPTLSTGTSAGTAGSR